MPSRRLAILSALVLPLLAASPADARRDRQREGMADAVGSGASVTNPDLRLPLGDDLPRSLPTGASNAPWFDVRIRVVRNVPYPGVVRDLVVPVQLWQRQFVDPGALHPHAYVREVRPHVSCIAGTWLCSTTSVEVRDSALASGIAAAVVYLGLDSANDLRLNVAVEGLTAVNPSMVRPTRMTVRNIKAVEGHDERVVLADGTMLVLTVHQRGGRASF